MSRRGGLQAKTVAMYRALDEQTEEWKALLELADMLGTQFNLSHFRSYRVITEWFEYRAGKVRREIAGRTSYYCSREGLELDPSVLSTRLWGKLPERFRKGHDIKRKAESPEDAMYATVMAAGWYLYGLRDCGFAFNKWAERHGLSRITLRPNNFDA